MIREDFAAAGGVSMGLRWAGIPDDQVIGVEWDKDAVATARVAGHRRWHTDVRDARVRDRDWGHLDGYSAGPPCQSFSRAGKGEGRAALSYLLEALTLVSAGWLPESAIAKVHNEQLDERSLLVLEPMLVIRRHRPRWVMLEQVPTVLPIWEAYAELMREEGYSVETDILQSEQYGVPQTRKRAILVARCDGVAASLPKPTHSKYYPRTPEKLDMGMCKWVSMAKALGWGMTARPSLTFTGGGTASGGPEVFGSQSRARMLSELESGRWEMGDVYNSHGAVRNANYPSPTLTASMDNGNFRWRKAVRDEVEPRVNNQSGTEFDLAWPCDRPSPGDDGREIVTMPGANANRFNGSTKSRNDGIRVSPQEAGILQSFPHDYPWQGTKTSQYQQIGNAHPPLMAEAIMRALLPELNEREEAA